MVPDLDGGFIRSRQVFTLLITTVLATNILFLPAIAAAEAKQDAWLTPVLATVSGLAVIFVVTELGRLFPDRNLAGYGEAILGPYLGRLLALAYFLYLLTINAIILREMAEFLIAVFMPETPLVVFVALGAVAAAYAARGGIEVVARVNEFIFPMFLGALLLIFILALPDARPARLLPFLENGIGPVLVGSLTPSAWRSETFTLAFYLPLVSDRERARSAGLAAVVFMSILLTADALLNVMVLGSSTARLLFPTFEVARLINIANFLNRIDPVFMALWITSVTVKIAIFHYVTVITAAQASGLREYRPLVFPAAFLLVALSVIVFSNVQELVAFVSKTFPILGNLFQILIPTLLLIVALIRGFRAPRRGSAGVARARPADAAAPGRPAAAG